MSNNGYDKEEIKRTHRLADIATKYGAHLKERGGKWTGCCPFPDHDDKNPSFTIFVGKDGDEIYKCFGCDRSGDLFRFVEEMEGVDFQGAIHILAGKEPAPAQPKAPPVDPYAGLQLLMPPGNPFGVARETPPIFNPKSGKHPVYRCEGFYPYTNSDGRVIGYVLRVRGEEGRKFCPSVMYVKFPDDHNGWCHYDMPRPRLYHLHDLFQRPKADVIITEGEKCADAAAALLPHMASITWCGGTAQWQKANWNPAAKRKVILWPDNDTPGRACMLGTWTGSNGSLAWKPGLIETLLANGCTVQVIRTPTKRPEGWDIADALAGGATSDTMAKYLVAELEPWSAKRVAEYRERTKPAPEPEPVVQLHPVEQPLPDESDTPEIAQAADNVIDLKTRLKVDSGSLENWQKLLERDDHGKPKKKSFQNYWVHIAHAPLLTGVFAWNAFAQVPCVMKAPPWEEKQVTYPRLLNNFDLPVLRAYVEHIYKVTPPANEMIAAVKLAAREHAFNPVTDYFDALKWDGVGRVQGLNREPWLVEYMGADKTLINASYGMCWLISCVARAYQPGVKADCMLVLEGKQGAGKSSVFEALARIDHFGAYFTDSLPDFASKDSKQLLGGKMIVEIPELAAYRSTKDVDKVKNFLSLRFDEYRPPYGEVPEVCQRTCVFAGTVNPGGSGYLNDETGERRFWPVRIKRIDVERVREDRDQLWAEAVHLYRADVQHYLRGDEEATSEKVTRKRQYRSAFHSAVVEHLIGQTSVTLPGVLTALRLEPHYWPAHQKQVAGILHTIGWERTMDGDDREVYTPRIDS